MSGTPHHREVPFLLACGSIINHEKITCFMFGFFQKMKEAEILDFFKEFSASLLRSRGDSNSRPTA